MQMKEIKTLADLESLDLPEIDAWFAERFGFKEIEIRDRRCYATSYRIENLGIIKNL